MFLPEKQEINNLGRMTDTNRLDENYYLSFLSEDASHTEMSCSFCLLVKDYQQKGCSP